MGRNETNNPNSKSADYLWNISIPVLHELFGRSLFLYLNALENQNEWLAFFQTGHEVDPQAMIRLPLRLFFAKLEDCETPPFPEDFRRRNYTFRLDEILLIPLEEVYSLCPE